MSKINEPTTLNPTCKIKCGRMTLSLDQQTEKAHWVLRDSWSDSLLMRVDQLSLLTPQIDGQCDPTVDGEVHQNDDGHLLIRFKPQEWGHHEITMVPIPRENAVDITMHVYPSRDASLETMHCFSADTGMNFHQLINYRNRHCSQEVWPELLLGGKECQTDTTSRDWQFAPHPTLFHFKRSDLYLSWGTMQLPVGTFGMHFSASKFQVNDWYVDFGGQGNGHPLKTGKRFSTATFRLRLSEQSDPYAAYTDWGRMLVETGQIPGQDKRAQSQQDWWLAPLYCTWIDQCNLASYMPQTELQEQVNTCNHATRTSLNTQMVRKAVKVIKDNELPFEAILLDEGWHKARGIWEPHPDRFADLRSFVDELHEQGFKVVIWWAWPEIEKAAESQIDPAWLMGQGKRNRHKCLMYDFSDPNVQGNYLKPLYRKLFSDEPGCYNLDGIKTDFQADKIHADMPLADVSWRGEESYLYQMHKLFYTTLKEIKPDAVHIGCAGHYWLARYIDINRTYDVHSSNVMEQANRARMLLSTTNHCSVAYDFHNYLDHLEEYFDSAAELGCSIEVGNVLTCKADPLTPSRDADQAYLNRLVAKLNG